MSGSAGLGQGLGSGLLLAVGALVVGVAAGAGARGRVLQLEVDAPGEEARDPLDVDALVLLMDLAQGVRDDAEVAAQLAHHRRDLLGVGQHLHRLRVRVVAQPERALYLAGELPASRE